MRSTSVFEDRLLAVLERTPRLHRVLTTYTTDPERPLGQNAYRTPLRDERVAAWLGAALGILFTLCFVTGLFDHIHQHPLTWLPVPARPAWLFRVSQGLHVVAGLAAMPVLVAKLWVVWPRFVSFPPARRIADVVERIGLFALVGGGIFMVFTGTANIAQWYPWRFSFEATHNAVAWIAMGGIVAHVGAKWSTSRRALRRRSRRPGISEADPSLGVVAEGAHHGLSRRGFLLTVASASGVLTLVTAGQTVRVLRRLAVLAPRRPGSGPQGQPVNRGAVNAGVTRTAVAPDYRLTVGGRVRTPLSFTRADLLAMPAHEVVLPMACVEGWSYTARWTGVRLRDLLAAAGAPADASVHVVSLERGSPQSVSFVNHFQAHDADTILATHINGQVLDLDHGYPVRLIGPDRPGVNQTKWVGQLMVE